MPRGQQDYGQYASQTQYATMSDLAQLAAWLIDYFSADNRGIVVFTDDFEGALLKWNKMTSNSGTSLQSSAHAKSGSQSIELDVAKVLAAGAGIYREFGIQPSQRLGCEINFCKPDSNTYYIQRLSYHDGTNAWQGAVKIDFSTNILSIQTGATTWQTIATLPAFSGSDQAFHPIKLVVDFDTKTYVRLIVDNGNYVVSNYSLYESVSAINQRILLEMELWGLNTTGGQLYLDDAVFTQSEP